MTVNVLAWNPGSNSLKFELVAAPAPARDAVQGMKLVSGVVEPIGPDAMLSLAIGKAPPQKEPVSIEGFDGAARAVLARLSSLRVDGYSGFSDLHLAAHRVVHGGGRFEEPVRIDDEVITAIDALGAIAPLHNAKSAAVIRASRSVLPRVPAVAVFDTAFHRSIPEHARRYGVPWELAERHQIRRYGFHGISHQYLLMRYSELTGIPLESANIITLHLEGGSSATAIRRGQPIDTSMGFTPLEGLMMGTRCGDIDPALVGFLAQQEKVDCRKVDEWLNHRSGLLGVSGISQDTRVLVRERDNPRVQLALDMFSYRVKKYIGAYLAAMGGAQAVVFGGGIGENTPEVRRRICEGLEWLGLELDPERNAAVIDREGRISRDSARLHAQVIPTQEGLMIAHEAVRCCMGIQEPGSSSQ